MPLVTFVLENGKEINHYSRTGSTLLEVARKANVIIDAPCSGNATCGKCKVKLLEGKLKSEVTRHISIEEYENGYRLSCISKITTNVKVLVPNMCSSFKEQVKLSKLTSLSEINISGKYFNNNNHWEVIQLELSEPTLEDTMPDNERLTRAIKNVCGNLVINIPYKVLKTLPDDLRNNSFQVKCIVKKDEASVTVFKVASANKDVIPLGVVFDIGTTSVAGLLVNLIDGSVLNYATAGNGQTPYGADVIHRIIESSKPEGNNKLQSAIINRTIKPMIIRMCELAEVETDSIVQVAIAANTTMNHLLLGFNAEYIRMEPYIPLFFDMENMKAGDINMNVHPNAELILAPNVGSYVGGDITSGVLASKLWNKSELSLLIDLGTNGEIVFGNKDFLISCACSAGPAFEGGNISFGMRATDGAIEACTINEETMDPTLIVIGDPKVKPIGICGSGIIDLITELYRCKIINAKGTFIREGDRITKDEFGISSYTVAFKQEAGLAKDITISEIDIDNFIRAKGSIFSAIKVLVESLDMSMEMVEKIYVAGGIGSAINIENAKLIGMLPNVPIERYEYIGNSSLAGAYEMIISTEAREKVKSIGRSMTYIELSTNPRYMDEFVAACFIPHTDGSLFKGGELC